MCMCMCMCVCEVCHRFPRTRLGSLCSLIVGSAVANVAAACSLGFCFPLPFAATSLHTSRLGTGLGRRLGSCVLSAGSAVAKVAAVRILVFLYSQLLRVFLTRSVVVFVGFTPFLCNRIHSCMLYRLRFFAVAGRQLGFAASRQRTSTIHALAPALRRDSVSTLPLRKRCV